MESNVVKRRCKKEQRKKTNGTRIRTTSNEIRKKDRLAKKAKYKEFPNRSNVKQA